ncbi:MAG: FMN-binding protein [Ruminococcaceae bacterium]|nr:FMN-binding protein [Oscillospiraceae bacterium]
MKKEGILKPVIVLTLIAVICGGGVAAVNALTGPVIAAAEQAAAEQARIELLPQAEAFEPVELSQEQKAATGAIEAYRAEGGNGYVVTVESRGYGGAIRIMVAVSPEGKLVNARVMSHEETTGVGTKATGEEYLSRYQDKTGEEAAKMDTVTGATVSSKAVRKALTGALELCAQLD